MSEKTNEQQILKRAEGHIAKAERALSGARGVEAAGYNSEIMAAKAGAMTRRAVAHVQIAEALIKLHAVLREDE